MRQRGWSKRLTLAYYQSKEEKEIKKKEELKELKFHAQEGNINSVEYANYLKGKRVELQETSDMQNIYKDFEERLNQSENK